MVDLNLPYKILLRNHRHQKWQHSLIVRLELSKGMTPHVELAGRNLKHLMGFSIKG
jgi:hypothetical protein